jgi:hypothetical protein
MSANLAPVAAPLSSVESARSALDAARGELAALDERLAAHQREVDENDLKKEQHRVAKITAVGAGLPPPRVPKLRVIDPEVAPILRAKRKQIAERVIECEGLLRRACVAEVERRYALAQDEFAQKATALVSSWRELVGARALLDAAGVRGEPLPDALYTDFSLPVLGKLRPICENHFAHFLASHALALGELSRAARQTRAEVERDLQMALPW